MYKQLLGLDVGEDIRHSLEALLTKSKKFQSLRFGSALFINSVRGIIFRGLPLIFLSTIPIQFLTSDSLEHGFYNMSGAAVSSIIVYTIDNLIEKTKFYQKVNDF